MGRRETRGPIGCHSKYDALAAPAFMLKTEGPSHPDAGLYTSSGCQGSHGTLKVHMELRWMHSVCSPGVHLAGPKALAAPAHRHHPTLGHIPSSPLSGFGSSPQKAGDPRVQLVPTWTGPLALHVPGPVPYSNPPGECSSSSTKERRL